MIWPATIPEFRHEYEGDRIAVVRRPDSEWFELTDETVTRVYLIGSQFKRQVLLRNFVLLGRYPPEGPDYEWGFIVSLSGVETKMPSRAGSTEQAIHDFLEAHRHRHQFQLLKRLVTFFEWVT